jgi:hypothetical protein
MASLTAAAPNGLGDRQAGTEERHSERTEELDGLQAIGTAGLCCTIDRVALGKTWPVKL